MTRPNSWYTSAHYYWSSQQWIPVQKYRVNILSTTKSEPMNKAQKYKRQQFKLKQTTAYKVPPYFSHTDHHASTQHSWPTNVLITSVKQWDKNLCQIQCLSCGNHLALYKFIVVLVAWIHGKHKSKQNACTITTVIAQMYDTCRKS